MSLRSTWLLVADGQPGLVNKAYDMTQICRQMGYSFTGTENEPKINVLLLFNMLSAHKQVLFEAFKKTLGNRAAIDLYIYNNELPAFRRLLLEKHHAYDKIVIIPHFNIDRPCPPKLIQHVAADKLVFIQNQIKGMSEGVSAVYADFRNDIFEALQKLHGRLANYGLLVLIYPRMNHFSREIVEGFKIFCHMNSFAYKVVDHPGQCDIGFGQVYVFLQEEDMVSIIERVLTVGLTVGKDVGMISYYESALKRVILDGITTVTSDYQLMGELAAACVLDDKVRQIAVPFEVNIRNSL